MAGADDERTWVDWMREASAWDILFPCPDMLKDWLEMVWLLKKLGWVMVMVWM